MVADRLDISGLEELATSKHENAQTAKGLDLTASFSASLKLMYEQTMENNRSPKDIAMRYAIRMYKQLLDIEGFATLCEEKREVAAEILKGVSHATPEEHKVMDINSFTFKVCPICYRDQYVAFTAKAYRHHGTYHCKGEVTVITSARTDGLQSTCEL